MRLCSLVVSDIFEDLFDPVRKIDRDLSDPADGSN